MKSINTKKYIENYVKIKDKNMKIIPLILNEPQMKLYNVIKQQAQEKKPIRVIILKARQMGFSTATEGIIFKNTATKKNVSSGIIAHKEEATTNLFNMSKRIFDNLPVGLQPAIKASNAKELIFDNSRGTGLQSKIKCMTAGSGGVGRSDTFNNLHISELAFWQGDQKTTMLGLMQAVPRTPGSMIIIESTANGFDYFKHLWDQAVRGDSDFYPLFVGWHELSEYQMPYNGFELTDYEIEIKDRYNLSNDQLQWRRWCIANNCGGDEEQFKQEYPINPHEAFVSTGSCIFNKEDIIKRLENLPDYDRGLFEYDYDGLHITNIRWVSNKKGPIKMYTDRKDGYPYGISVDTAGEGSDFFGGIVIDNTTGKQVCVLHDMYDESLYARQMFCMGIYYNKALVGIESNFSTYPNRELERLEYPNLYIREREDSITGGIIRSYGFKTTKVTRPIIISILVDIFRENIDLIVDADCLNEAITFIRNAGRPEAQQGCHDDMVISMAIGYYIRDSQAMTVEGKPAVVTKNTFVWSDDLVEDYYNAPTEIQERMIERYGEINCK